MIREPARRLSAVIREPARRLSAVIREPARRLSAVIREPARRLSAVIREPARRLSAVIREPARRLSAVIREPSRRLRLCPRPARLLAYPAGREPNDGSAPLEPTREGFQPGQFRDVFYPISIAAFVLLIVAVILYNVQVRKLHKHPPLVALQEWLLWTAVCVFGLLLVEAIFKFWFLTVVATIDHRPGHVHLDPVLPLPAHHRGLQPPARPRTLDRGDPCLGQVRGPVVDGPVAQVAQVAPPLTPATLRVFGPAPTRHGCPQVRPR